MRRFSTTMVGAAFLVLAASFAGCGGDSATAPGTGFLTEATHEDFKLTDLSPFENMKSQMQEIQKKGTGSAYKPTPSKEKSESKK